MSIIQFPLLIHTNDFFFSLPIDFLQRNHHKRISQQAHVSLSLRK